MNETVTNISTFEQFIQSQRTTATKKTYARALVRVFKTPEGVDSFIQTATAEKKTAESLLLTWLSENRDRFSGSSVRTWLAAVRSLLEFADLPTPLNWKKISKSAPKRSKSQDRPVTIEEIRRIFGPADLRFKFVLSVLASSGVRIGAFDYFKLSDLKLIQVEDLSESHLDPKRVEIASLRVYGGESEQYDTFVSSEAVQLFKAYSAERERAGEELSGESPLVRNPVTFRRDGQTVQRTSAESISSQIGYAWEKVGLAKREFKLVHGFRKNFKTSLENAGMKSITCEALLGHLSQLDASYYRPSTDQLAQEYARFQNCLFIDPALSLANEKDKILKEARSAISSEGSRVQVLEAKLAELNATIDALKASFLEIKKQAEKPKS